MTMLNVPGPPYVPTPDAPVLDMHTAVRLIATTGFSFFKVY